MNENYYALAVAIINGCTPEHAFEMLDTGHITKKYDKDQSEAAEMAAIKAQGLTYKQIGEIFGISDQAAYRRIRRYKERCGKQ